MISLSRISLLATSLLLSGPLAAQTVFTQSAGYVKIGNTTAGENAIPANTDYRISVPFDTKKEFVGTVSSTSATEITVDGNPGFATDQWSIISGIPYQARISNGDEEGLWAVVVSNTADTLSVIVEVGDLTNVQPGDGLEILPCWTVASLFADQEIPPGTQILLFSGNLPGENISSDTILVWNGTNWLFLLGRPEDAPDLIADDLVIHPGESFILRTLANPIANLALFGTVPSTRHRIVVSKLDASLPQDSTIGYFGPVPEPIGDSNLGFNPGDQLLVFDNLNPGTNQSASRILVFSGSTWLGLIGISGDVSDSFMLEPGAGYILRQPSIAPAVDTEWRDVQSFNE